MRNGAALVLLAGATQVNGLFLDDLPLWRQALYLVLGVLAYLQGRRLPFPHEWTVLGALGAPGAVLTLVDFTLGSGVLGSFVLACALPWSAGRFRRQQAELLAAGAERVTHLEQEQRLIAERAELRERTRIAADIHDSLGHDLALIALRAGALELAGDLSEQNQQAAAELRAAAATATDRLRETIGVLRRAGPIEPHIEHASTVVDNARSAGMVVTTQGFDGVSLPPHVERTVAYIVRESLTNAARHAPGAEVVIRVERTATLVMVLLTTFDEDGYVDAAMTHGVDGFLLKASDPRELILGVRAVADGAAYLSPRIAQKVIARFDGTAPTDTVARRRVDALTDREREVLALLGRGLSNADIGRALFLAEATVKFHVSAILRRLALDNRVQAAILAYEAGLTRGDSPAR
ncbi:LuxR C-terminal-related transcriptional regulator [Nocardia salmonicida]|uniref:LuxR C-terminal-related transcriptional regulator n=1 Tax=Nocardia salmonicida TaxID=53431 RepID=UPI003682ED92